MIRRSDARSDHEAPEAAVARLTGRDVTGARRVSGALTEVARADGTVVMVKRGDGPDAVRAEAAGLRWLAAAGTVRVPAVLGSDDTWLVTERVPTGTATREAAARLGRGLAALHAAGAPAFGAPPPGGPGDAYIGPAPMRNSPRDDWPRWYAEQRVLPYLRRAVDDGTVRAAEAGVIETVCERLPALAGPPEPPARLHGDLWNGNVLWGANTANTADATATAYATATADTAEATATADTVERAERSEKADSAEGTGTVAWIIDPAAHGGHRETDLAMLRLFGCPYLDDVLEAYREAAPLAPGWAERVGLHQLFPLLVHTVLFGRGYAEQALAVARSALAR
ncbi:fructosamine kinase family protein [Streptomyces sp. NPDC006458]|uniref:fructosamine kinase family protein n=1 Tax=Streptomyces sp. NPDC006458 TaxID=3154302 RepID=UPI00339DD73E